MTRRLRPVVAAAVVLTIVTGGCGYASRKEHAALLVDAAKKAEKAGTGRGSLAVSVQVIKGPPTLSSAAQGLVEVPAAPLQLAYASHAASSAPVRVAAVGGLPEAVFVGPVVYFKRPASDADTQSQFGFRAWSRLDFSRVGRKDKNKLANVNVVNPVNPTYLVRMLAGTLSGSVEDLGPATVNGVRTTHFRMSIDRSKAFARYGDKAHQAIDKAFKSNNFTGNVYKNAEAWIGADGLPRRFILPVRQKLDLGGVQNVGIEAVFAITYTVDLSDFGAPVTIRAPHADATAEVNTLNELLASARA